MVQISLTPIIWIHSFNHLLILYTQVNLIQLLILIKECFYSINVKWKFLKHITWSLTTNLKSNNKCTSKLILTVLEMEHQFPNAIFRWFLSVTGYKSKFKRQTELSWQLPKASRKDPNDPFRSGLRLETYFLQQQQTTGVHISAL